MSTTIYADILQDDDSLITSVEISVTGRRDVSAAWDFVCGAIESITVDLTSYDPAVGVTHRIVVLSTETREYVRDVENWIIAKHWADAKEMLEEKYWKERDA